jgi:chromosome segregation ATPase
LQEITNKCRHADRDHADQIQRFENELKSLRLRSESGVDLLRKENDLTKSKATKTIDELEKQLSTITEKFFDMQKLFEQKLAEQQTNYQNNIQQCEHDYEKKLQSLKQDLKQFNEKYQVLAQHHEQAQNELKQKNQELKQYNETCTQQRELIEKSEKAFVQIKTDLEKKFHEKVCPRRSLTPTPSFSTQIQEINDKARHNEQQLMDNLNREHAKVCEKLKLEYEQGKDQ